MTNSNDKPGIIKRIFNPAVIGAFFGGVIATVGVTAFAASEAMGGWHDMALVAQGSSAGHAAHLQLMLNHLYKAVDATDAQKAQIAPIAQQALVDVQAFHDQAATGHTQLLSLFAQNTIDRTRLEAVRVQELQLADQVSKRLAQALADIGDVLTPAQRQQLESKMQNMHHHSAHG